MDASPASGILVLSQKTARLAERDLLAGGGLGPGGVVVGGIGALGPVAQGPAPGGRLETALLRGGVLRAQWQCEQSRNREGD